MRERPRYLRYLQKEKTPGIDQISVPSRPVSPFLIIKHDAEPGPLRVQAAFTVIEVTFAFAIFSYFAVASVLGLVEFNRFASVSRYRTLALAAAQQRMDQVMATSWSVLGSAPAVLTTGTTTESNLVLNSDPFNSQAALSSAFSSLDTQVQITSRTTAIATVANNPRLRHVTVIVNYSYCGFCTP